MLKNLDFIAEDELTKWIVEHLDSDEVALSAGYQGRTLLYSDNEHQLVIKIALGNFFTRPINQALLKHEHHIYQQLQGLDAVPICYGLANNQYLVLEYINGTTMRQASASFESNSDFFVLLFEAIEEMHHRQVAHFDLKRMENLMVSHDNKPKLIDFGVSIHYKGGWHWLNSYLFNLAKQFDLNAWLRHKYKKRMDLLSDADRVYYHPTNIEIYSKKIKRFYRDKVQPIFK